MSIDEELDQLTDSLRRLKIEYHTYFGGGSPRPPNVLIFRVERIINKYNSGAAEMSFRQRYRFSQLAQSYFAHKDLWRKKLKEKEEGKGSASQPREVAEPKEEQPFSITWSEPDTEQDKIRQLLQAVVRARSQAGEPSVGIDPGRFAEFIREKTRQFKQSLECDTIQLTVRVENGRVKLSASKAAPVNE